MLSLFKKKNSFPTATNNQNCLNCGFPFQGYELFCPECGQKNKKDALSFKSFMNEVFQGFTSWDAKFWKTIVPLLTKPGKVSRDFIEGKRVKYTNPFRFYITTSILFFLLLSLTKAITNYRELSTGKTNNDDTKNEISIGIKVVKDDNDSKTRVGIRNAIFFGKNIVHFANLQSKYPNLPTDKALDSLNEKKTFLNRFLYNKAKTLNDFGKDTSGSVNKLFDTALSQITIAIFILLPLLALFLKLLYIRNYYKYIEHLIFLFHLQTFLFILLIIFHLISFIFSISDTTIISNIIIVLLLAYIFIAMKVFYQQNYLKTAIKYILTVTIYSSAVIIGTGAIILVAFAVM